MIPVDLFGQPADYDAIATIARRTSLFVLDDAAQAFGAHLQQPQASARSAHATATSFFPAKPLGCYGDGGAVLHRRRRTAAILKSLRVHGAGHRQIRQRAHRHERPARHHPGGGADREAEDFPGRDRGARPRRGALHRRRSATSRPCRMVPARLRARSGRSTRSGCRPGSATRSPRRCKRAGHPDRDLLSQARCTGRRPTATIPVADGGLPVTRAARRRGHQPADARLSRRADAGPHRRRGAARAVRIGTGDCG